MLICDHNKNETPVHYELKQISKYILWSLGYKHIATEVYGCCGCDNFEIKGCFHKNIIDVIGCKCNDLEKDSLPEIKTMGLECKASLSDFNNGFCTACEYTYIIAPVGVIPKSKLPPKIGLIEVDLDNYEIKVEYGKTFYSGIKIVKRASSRLCNRFEDYDELQKFALAMVRRIAYRNTVELIYKHPEIKIERDR